MEFKGKFSTVPDTIYSHQETETGLQSLILTGKKVGKSGIGFPATNITDNSFKDPAWPTQTKGNCVSIPAGPLL